MVEADLVIESGRDQGQHQGQEVDEDGDASGSEGQHSLDLDPFELGKVIPKRIVYSLCFGIRIAENLD